MRLSLEEYDFEIEYIKGESNVVSDALSRITIQDLKELNQNNKETLVKCNILTRAQAQKKLNNNYNENIKKWASKKS